MSTAATHPVMRFVKLSDDARRPTKGSPRAAGFDLYSARDVVIPPRGRACVRTDIAVELPDGCYGRIAPRSSMAMNEGIDVGGGVIDADYRGNVCVVLFNHDSINVVVVEKGQRIAQLICENITYPSLEECKTLSETVRNTDGFGSTGK